MSNHLGDTNKMVDTPRTETEVNRQKCWSDDIITIDANFAAQLERELNAANYEVQHLREAYIQLQEGNERQRQRIKRLEEMYEKEIGENDKFIGTNLQALLTRELNESNQRIKRLEEALEGTVKWIVDLADNGDAGFWDVDEQPEIIAARAALKAKEAKP